MSIVPGIKNLKPKIESYDVMLGLTSRALSM